MAVLLYYVTPETGINVVGVATSSATALPTTQSILQAFVPIDANGNAQQFNADGSVKQLAVGSAFMSLPAATAAGSALVTGPTGVEITCPPGTSVTYTIASTQPIAAPSLVRTFGNPNGAASYAADRITCATGTTVYITAITTLGTLVPFYRSV